jgi:hypothetical protein
MRAANPDDGGWRLDAHRIRFQTGDPAGDECRGTAQEFHYEREFPLRRLEFELGKVNLAARAKRHTRIVFERDTKAPVHPRAKRVIAVDHIARVRRQLGAASYDDGSARDNFDVSGRRFLGVEGRGQKSREHCSGD